MLFNVPLLLYLKNLNKVKNYKYPIPAELCVVVISTLVTLLGKLDTNHDVPVIGEVPPGLPVPQVPAFPVPFSVLVMPATLVAIVTFIISSSIFQFFSNKHAYPVDPNQELRALGLANLAGSMVQCFPASGSLSRSAVVDSIGVHSPLHNFFAVLMLILCLLVLTPSLYTLPNAGDQQT